MDDIHLNVALLRARVPNLTVAARSAGLRPATVSNLCTGKIPIGRAEVRTLAMLASLADCTMDELIVHGSPMGMVETGIKVLDLLAPIVKGGTIGLVARPGIGQMAMLAELLHRFKIKSFATIFWNPADTAAGMEELLEEAEAVCTTADEILNQVLVLTKNKDILLCADRTVVLSGELYELERMLNSKGCRPMTTLLVDISGEAVDDDTPFGPLDTFMRFDTELTTRGLFPAVDPVASTSVMLEGGQLESAHLLIQQQARKLMRRYREMKPLVQFRGVEKFSDSEKQTYFRGERLEAYLSQPFYIAEPFTKKTAEWISLQETLEDVRNILDGRADDIPVDQLYFTGRLKS